MSSGSLDPFPPVPDGPVQHLLAYSSTALFIGTLEGTVAVCNAAACQLLLRSPAGLIGAAIRSFDQGRAPDRVEGMHALLAEGEGLPLGLGLRQGRRKPGVCPCPYLPLPLE